MKEGENREKERERGEEKEEEISERIGAARDRQSARFAQDKQTTCNPRMTALQIKDHRKPSG